MGGASIETLKPPYSSPSEEGRSPATLQPRATHQLGDRVPSTGDDIGIGSRVRAARQRLGWSREALAFHAGISWSAISQLEAGRRRNLRPTTLAALAGALGVTVDYLVSGRAVTPAMLEHHVLLYTSDEDFVTATVSFLSQATERSEAALAVATDEHCRLLRERLGAEERRVEFTDHDSWCDNPSAALSRLRTFVNEHLDAGSPWVRVLVEPVVTPTSDAKARSWAKYESLLNVVFRSVPLTVLCAYDAAALDPGFITEMLVTHPHTFSATGTVSSPDYADPVEFVLESEPVAGESRAARG
jgi:transcriptional regulator with XRE-family HTH domain